MEYIAYLGAKEVNGKYAASAIYSPKCDLKKYYSVTGIVPAYNIDEAYCLAVLTAIDSVSTRGDCTKLYVYYTNSIVLTCDDEDYREGLEGAGFIVDFLDYHKDEGFISGCTFADLLASMGLEKAEGMVVQG